MVNIKVRPGEEPRTGPVHNRSKETSETSKKREKIGVETKLSTRLKADLELEALEFLVERRKGAEILPAIVAKTYTSPGRRSTSPEIKARNKRI